MENHTENIVTQIEEYLLKYITFSDEVERELEDGSKKRVSGFATAAALWTIATHCYQEFDVFPYLVITAFTKRAGKTTLKDLLLPVVNNGRSFSAKSPSSMFSLLEKNEQDTDGLKDVTMAIEEAEDLLKEDHPAREFINKGYEKGDVITRKRGNEIVEYNCFCPKIAILIGSVYDTMNDRSIPVFLRRRTPVEALKSKRVRKSVKQAEAEILRGAIKEEISFRREDIRAHYAEFEQLSFLNERDELLWQSLFAIAHVFCPERVEELKRIAVDIAMEKTAPQRKSTGDDWEAAEREADDLEYRIYLLRDMLYLCKGKDFVGSNDVLEQLYALPTAPWRKFRGRGLTTNDMGNLLDVLGLHPKPIRVKSGKAARQAFARGYTRKDMEAAAQLSGLTPDMWQNIE